MYKLNDPDALDDLYDVIDRLYRDKCDLVYIQGEVESAYNQIEWADQVDKKNQQNQGG